jgi:hypothetical protein
MDSRVAGQIEGERVQVGETLLFGIGSSGSKAAFISVRGVTLGNERVTSMTFAVVSDQQAGISRPRALILGQDFLNKYRVLFAMRERRIYFARVDG